MSPKTIASAGCDTSIIFNEHFKLNYTPKLKYLVLFFKMFSRKYNMPLKPLAMQRQAM